MSNDLKKNFSNETGPENLKQITRIGVYGVLLKDGKMLLVRQQKGPYAGKLDFPGGGIEFGESAEEALRREFMEEVAIEFDSLKLIDNLTTVVNVPSIASNEPYIFFQIGMIYQISGYQPSEKQDTELQHAWIDLKSLSKDQCSNLLWEYKQLHIDKK